MTPSEEQRALDQVADRLLAMFPGVQRDLIEMTVSSIQSTFAAARGRDFVPLLVERETRERLEKLPR